MNAEDAAVNDSTQCEVVKDLAAPSPYIRRPVLPLTLVIKAVYLRDLSALVVAADEGDTVRVAYFEREQ